MDTSFSARVAQAAEFAGYGPVAPAGPFSVRAHCLDRVFQLQFRRRDGSILGEAPVLVFQNPVDPQLQATMSLIIHVYVKHGQLPLPGLQEVNRLIFSDRLSITVRYLWLDDPIRHTGLVLSELHLSGVPQWHSTDAMPYGAPEDERFWDRATELLDDFQKHGHYPQDHERDLTAAIAHCEGDTPEEA